MPLNACLKDAQVVSLSAESGDPSADEVTRIRTNAFLEKMCGLTPPSSQEEKACMDMLRRGLIDLDAQTHAKMQWRDPLFDGVTYCGFADRMLEMVLGHAHSGAEIIDYLLSHIHPPHSARILPFWLPEDATARQGLPGFSSQHNASTQASDLCWKRIIMHPDTHLETINTKGRTVMDLWLHRFAQQVTPGDLELTKGLVSYRRLCLLMQMGAPLHHCHLLTRVTESLLPIAQDYAQKFTNKHLAPLDIDPVIFRHWSVCGMLDAMTEPDLWQGHESHLAGLWACLPENERELHAHRATSSMFKHFAPPPSSWSTEVTKSPASNRGRG